MHVERDRFEIGESYGRFLNGPTREIFLLRFVGGSWEFELGHLESRDRSEVEESREVVEKWNVGWWSIDVNWNEWRATQRKSMNQYGRRLRVSKERMEAHMIGTRFVIFAKYSNFWIEIIWLAVHNTSSSLVSNIVEWERRKERTVTTITHWSSVSNSIFQLRRQRLLRCFKVDDLYEHIHSAERLSRSG